MYNVPRTTSRRLTRSRSIDIKAEPGGAIIVREGKKFTHILCSEEHALEDWVTYGMHMDWMTALTSAVTCHYFALTALGFSDKARKQDCEITYLALWRGETCMIKYCCSIAFEVKSISAPTRLYIRFQKVDQPFPC